MNSDKWDALKDAAETMVDLADRERPASGAWTEAFYRRIKLLRAALPKAEPEQEVKCPIDGAKPAPDHEDCRRDEDVRLSRAIESMGLF